MTTTSPSYETPPVNQVALEVHYERMPRVRTAHFGVLWDRLGGPTEFPEVDDLFPDEVEIETFPAEVSSARVDFSFSGRPPITRTRLSGDRKRVEVQDNALGASWYGEPLADDYPRYEWVSEQFKTVLDAWTQVVADLDLGALRMQQIELSYRNRLLINSGWSAVDDLQDEVLLARWLPTAGGIPTEDVHVYQRHVLNDDGGKPLGRLYISFDSAREYKGRKSLDLSLTVRRVLRGDTPEAMMDSFDAAHDLIVHTFDVATAERMHALWGKRS